MTEAVAGSRRSVEIVAAASDVGQFLTRVSHFTDIDLRRGIRASLEVWLFCERDIASPSYGCSGAPSKLMLSVAVDGVLCRDKEGLML